MDVHLRDLRYFTAVAEELSFTRAAERLYVSQPALSKQIRGLENSMRVTLFERNRREVRLTSAGEALLVDVQRLLADWDELARSVADVGARDARVLRAGTLTSTLDSRLARSPNTRCSFITPSAPAGRR